MGIRRLEWVSEKMSENGAAVFHILFRPDIYHPGTDFPGKFTEVFRNHLNTGLYGCCRGLKAVSDHDSDHCQRDCILFKCF